MLHSLRMQAGLLVRGAANPLQTLRQLRNPSMKRGFYSFLRQATTEVRFRGFVIPKGWAIRVCTQESHRDPTLRQCVTPTTRHSPISR